MKKLHAVPSVVDEHGAASLLGIAPAWALLTASPRDIQQSFDEIQLADRKERVKAMQDSYDKIPDIRVALKLKILAQIRAEVGQDQPIQHVHAVHVGVNIPPRAETYEEWLDQNQLVVHEAKSKARIDDPEDVSPRTGRATGSRLLSQLRR